MANFTASQQAAITHHGHNVLVSASAGSGKTTVLVERVLQSVLHGQDVTRLLVVTFTNAAAAEMKDRITVALKQELTNHRQEMDEETRHHLAQQIGLVASAPISTIDAFALQIVQQYYYTINLDPGFRILADPTEAIMIQEGVWSDLREVFFSSDEADRFRALSTNFGTDRSDDPLADLIMRVYEYAQTTTDPDGWIAGLADNYRNDLTATGPLMQQLRSTAGPIVEQVQRLLNQAAELLEPEPALAKVADNVAQTRSLTEIVAQALPAENYTAVQTAINDVDWPRWPGGKVADEAAKETKNAAKELRDQAKDVFTKSLGPLFALSASELEPALTAAHELVDELSHVCLEFKGAYWAEKQRRHVLDFGDIEQSARVILGQADPDSGATVGQIYRDAFDEVLVDEYQDTNPLQEAILNAVSQDGVGNRFMVGDVKQSIYGFRLAEPQLFLDKYARYTPSEDLSGDPEVDPAQMGVGERITLAENFRSSRNIIDFTNLIFRQVMDRQVGDIDYQGGEELLLGATDIPADFAPDTEILMYVPGDAEEGANADLDKDVGQVRAVIDRIRALMTHPEKRLYDRKKGDYRDLEYRDITLLVPTRSQNLQIQEEFAAADIPIVINDAQNYFKTTELQVMLSLLKVVDNPLQEIPLVAVLRSPIVGMTADELAVVRLADRNAPYYAATDAFVRQYDAATADGTTTSAYRKLSRFNDQLRGFRELARGNRLVDLIWSIYNTTGYLDFVGGMPGGPQRQANLRALYDRAHAYEEGGFKGLFAFVHFIELMQQRDKDLDTPVTIDPDTNAIHLMTIHGSKGLQFPVVFLMNASRSLRSSGSHGGQAILSGGQIGVQWLQPDTRVQVALPQYELVRQERDAREQAEALRVLYVALTRAEQRLFVVGYGETQAKLEQSWRDMANTDALVLPAYNRLTASSLLTLIGGSIIRHPQYPGQDMPTTALTSDATSFQVSWINHPAPVTGQTATAPIVQPPLTVDVDQWFEYQYPYTAATQTTGFQAVSEIKRLFDDPSLAELHADPQSSGHQVVADGQDAHRFTQPFATPKFMTAGEDERPTAAAVGTATHQVLQSLDLHQAITPDYVATVIEDLVSRNLIAAPVARNVNVEHVVAFFTTPLGQTLLATPATVHREVPFAMLMPAGDVFPAMRNDEQNLLVHGIMDGFVTTADGVILYDYKTDHIGHHQDAVVQRYSGQLRLYAQALRQIQPEPVVGLRLVLLETNTVVALPVEGAYDGNSNKS